MTRKIDPATLDHHVIRRALQNAGSFETCFSEFTATWHDSKTSKQVDFTGTIDSEIALKTAQVQGSGEVYELRKMFTESELRAFNYSINAQHNGRLRSAA